MPSDKAPGPDGFTGAFFKKCWDIIKGDIMKVIHQFKNLCVGHLQWINSANIVLLPKKEGAKDITDYRPISLIHGVAKIIAKMIATRLVPHMNGTAKILLAKIKLIHFKLLGIKPKGNTPQHNLLASAYCITGQPGASFTMTH
jgi:hypothetical protein